MNLEDILDAAVDIAEEASTISLSYFRQPILIETKENQTPVTVADKKTEEFIRSELTKAFPGFGILGEEFGEESPNAQYVWTVDPIDGTRSFIKGIPLFGTLIGLLEDQEPIAGIMVLPALDETYWAGRGLGTYCNGLQVHVSPTAAIENANVSVGDVYAFEDSGHRDYLNNLIDQTEILRGYTDCFGHSLVFRGAMDAMIDPVVSIWDIAPLAALATEAGGEYYDFNGQRSIRSGNFITSNSALKGQILAAIAKRS